MKVLWFDTKCAGVVYTKRNYLHVCEGKKIIINEQKEWKRKLKYRRPVAAE